MSYTLVGSEKSPFVRVCRMLMMQNKIDFEFRVLNFVVDKAHAEALAKASPINRVPILMDGEQTIFDSRVIVNHLVKKHGLPALTLDEENFVSTAYSCMDSGVVLFLMRQDGFDVNGSGFFLARQRERIPRNLEFMTPWARGLNPANARDWNFASMSLYAFLFWAQARQLIDLKNYPEMASFVARFSEAVGVRETSF